MVEMRPFICRDGGSITGAHWAPAGSGFDCQNQATAWLGVDGSCYMYAWRDITRLDRRANGGRGGFVVVGREHSGKSETPVDPAIRAVLEDALVSAMVADQRDLSARLAYQAGSRDSYGNLLSEMED